MRRLDLNIWNLESGYLESGTWNRESWNRESWSDPPHHPGLGRIRTGRSNRTLGVGNGHGSDQGDEQQGTGQSDGDQVVGIQRGSQAGDVGFLDAGRVVDLR